MSLTDVKRVTQLVTNVASQGASLKLTDLADFTVWAQTMETHFVQANVRAVLHYENLEAFIDALIEYNSASKQSKTIGQLQQERNGDKPAESAKSATGSKVKLKQSEQPEFKEEETSDNLKLIKQKRDLSRLTFSENTTTEAIERFYHLANGTIVCSIRSALDESLHHLIDVLPDKESAYHVWQVLQQATRTNVVAQLNMEIRKLAAMRLERGQNPVKFMHEFRKQIARVHDSDGSISFKTAAAMYLGAISSEDYTFELSKLQDKLASDKSTNWDDIRYLLMPRFTELQAKATSEGFAMSAIAARNSKLSQPHSKTIVCSFCDTANHTESECQTKQRYKRQLHRDRAEKAKLRFKQSKQQGNNGKLNGKGKGDKKPEGKTNTDKFNNGPESVQLAVLAASASAAGNLDYTNYVFVDSCAHHHACSVASMFESIERIEPVPFTVADKRTKWYDQGGFINIKTAQGLNVRLFAAYVPEFIGTLLSYGQIIAKGCSSTTSKKGVMKIRQDRQVIITARMFGRVFIMDTDLIDSNKLQDDQLVCGLASLSKNDDLEDLEMWHQAYGHQHDAAVRRHLRQFGIYTKCKRPFCEHCAATKATSRISNTNASSKRQQAPLAALTFNDADGRHGLPEPVASDDYSDPEDEDEEYGSKINIKSKLDSTPKAKETFSKPEGRVHTDLVGPFRTKSKAGHRYLWTMVDEDTSYAEVVGLASKHPHEQLQAFLARREKSARPVRIMRTDGGGEFQGRFADILKAKGILQESSTPHMPSQNGKAERFNRTIVELARTIARQAGFPEDMWFHAVMAALHLYNHSLRSGCARTPYQQFFGRQGWHPKHLLPLGCKAYTKEHGQKGKMDDNGIPCVVLGFDNHKSGVYKLLNLHTKRMTTSNHVRADRTCFPFTAPDHVSAPSPSRGASLQLPQWLDVEAAPSGSGNLPTSSTSMAAAEEENNASFSNYSVSEEENVVFEEEKHADQSDNQGVGDGIPAGFFEELSKYEKEQAKADEAERKRINDARKEFNNKVDSSNITTTKRNRKPKLPFMFLTSTSELELDPNLAPDSDPKDPSNFKEAMNRSDAARWKEACNAEIAAIQKPRNLGGVRHSSSQSGWRQHHLCQVGLQSQTRRHRRDRTLQSKNRRQRLLAEVPQGLRYRVLTSSFT